MIKASELRIGNLLSFSNGIEPTRIVTVGRRFFSSAAIEKEDGDFNVTPYYSGIALTEEWLLNFGFKVDEAFVFNDRKAYLIGQDAERYIWCAGNLLKPLKEGHIIITRMGIGGMGELQPCEDVHQLQNLYFALTGIELKLKDTK